MKKIKAVVVVGARPNFMKAAPLLRAMRSSARFVPLLLHTGQHYDAALSGTFFKELNLPKPDIYLGVGRGTMTEQMGKIMALAEKYFLKIRPNVVIVVGDVTSTIAAALAAKRLDIPVAHVEAGLRSFDRLMPEEINRVLTDNISDFLFTTEKSGNENLKREGIDKKKIYFVGNTMIDTLVSMKKKIAQSKTLKRFSLQRGAYAVLTLHRPSNVDSKQSLHRLLHVLGELDVPIVFPVHPRTKKNMRAIKNIICVGPLGYIDFMKLVENSRCVFTDSGGIQDETTMLGVPCITLRKNTERPVTITHGTNVIVGTDPQKITYAYRQASTRRSQKIKSPLLWDGNAAERIVSVLAKALKIARK